MENILWIAMWAIDVAVWAIPAYLLWVEWNMAGGNWRRFGRSLLGMEHADPALEIVLSVALAVWWSVAAPALMMTTI